MKSPWWFCELSNAKHCEAETWPGKEGQKVVAILSTCRLGPNLSTNMEYYFVPMKVCGFLTGTGDSSGASECSGGDLIAIEATSSDRNSRYKVGNVMELIRAESIQMDPGPKMSAGRLSHCHVAS
jgi:hypothetical protein